jgi:hypothetical protein
MRSLIIYFVIIVSLLAFTGCTEETPSRYDIIPDDAVKMTPDTDLYPPIMHSEEWQQPVPMEGPINSAGAEDAPVISQDGKTFIFFFTPDVSVPPEKQVLDKVTGIWWCTKENGVWTEPQKAVLSNSLALDGPFCFQNNLLWFGSVRQGNYREIDIYTAELENGEWKNWQNVGYQLNVEYAVGELYTTSDGNTMIYHSSRNGTFGGNDMWMIEKTDGAWSTPVNLGPTINTEQDEGWPYLSADGNELWFNRWSGQGYIGPALFRSVKLENGSWSQPVEMVSNFAGDPAMDSEGNLYFTHHYYSEEMEMIEADIYVCYKNK